MAMVVGGPDCHEVPHKECVAADCMCFCHRPSEPTPTGQHDDPEGTPSSHTYGSYGASTCPTN